MSQTRLRIENHTRDDIVDSFVEVRSNEGWKYNNRPDLNFTHVRIPAHAALEKPEHLDEKSSVFTITLVFRDKSEDKFSIDQKAAVDRAEESLHLYKIAHDISWRRGCKDVLIITIDDPNY